MQWKGKEILIIGMGISGKALATFFKDQKQRVWVYDDCQEKTKLSFHKAYKAGFVPDLCLVSPGISFAHPLVKWMKEQGVALSTEVFFALDNLKDSGAKIVGITGTNGKSTTTSLLEHLFKNLGFSALACGNIGVPLISQLQKITPDHYVFVELSSFQLEWANKRVLDAGIFLNLQEDHLDRYGNLLSYFEVKWRLSECLKPQASLFLHESLSPYLKNKKICHPSIILALKTPPTFLFLDKKRVFFGIGLNTY